MNKYEFIGIMKTIRDCISEKCVNVEFPEDDHIHYKTGKFLAISVSDLVDCLEEIEEYYNHEN